ncbi:hypothetical protein [Thermomonospora cellulosilytica]|uniref:Uncharacterized protein n=1 Tax=Thermomonospora cellulosilytica TaxID=1411118 RepID=A0A7W3MZV5_9ACTN|nr:hypothetical protein [Thermomonospora cellulosilytica]MBA9004939.1 hypothetical protein [Thermomonospora cellulosilytica]
MTEKSEQRIDDTPGAAGSVTESSDAAAEANPAEQAGGVAESLPGTDPDRAQRSSSADDRPPRHRTGEHSSMSSGAAVPEGGGGDYVDEFRPEPVRQVPSEGRQGAPEGETAQPTSPEED